MSRGACGNPASAQVRKRSAVAGKRASPGAYTPLRVLAPAPAVASAARAVGWPAAPAPSPTRPAPHRRPAGLQASGPRAHGVRHTCTHARPGTCVAARPAGPTHHARLAHTRRANERPRAAVAGGREGVEYGPKAIITRAFPKGVVKHVVLGVATIIMSCGPIADLRTLCSDGIFHTKRTGNAPLAWYASSPVEP